MRRPRCEECGRYLPDGLHRAIKYHKKCKKVARRKQKLACWHRNKEHYR